MQDVFSTILSQYANSPVITRLIETMNDWIDPSADIEAFIFNIWDLRTASGIGLDIWGRIVGISRVINYPVEPTYFGFNVGAGATDYAPLSQGPFRGGPEATQNLTLSDEAFRTLIFLKAATNITAASAPAINAVLQSLFANHGRAYVNDLGYMSQRYTFEFYLTPPERAILLHSGVMPAPTGVKTFILEIPVGTTFGFVEAGNAQPFGSGTFLAQGALEAQAQ